MDGGTPQTSAPQPPRNWWSRNWKWFVPTGCLTLVVLVVAFVAAIVLFVFGIMKSTDVYRNSLTRARDDARVTQALGSPLDDGWFVSGSTNVDGAAGTADLAIPVSGPKGKGTIYVAATKSAGEWTYSKLVVEVAATKERIDLIGVAPSGSDEQ